MFPQVYFHQVYVYVVIYLRSKKYRYNLKIIKAKQKNMNFKCNINIKAIKSGEHKKSCVPNLLVSIKYLMVVSNMLVLLILWRFSLQYKREQYKWLYSRESSFLVNSLDSEEGNENWKLKTVLKFVFMKVT